MVNGSDRPSTLFDKLWRRHRVTSAPLRGDVAEPEEPGMPAILYVDLHLVHEVTSPQAFAELDRRGLGVRRPDRALATMDHTTPTKPGIGRRRLRVIDPRGAAQLDTLEANCSRLTTGAPCAPIRAPRSTGGRRSTRRGSNR